MVSVSASVSHTHNRCMWIRFWVQFAKNSHHISEENGPPSCTCLSVFYSLLSLIPPQGQLCVSAALLLQCSILPNEAAPCCLTLWTSPARLHLWMTDVLFYILLRLSLSHTPTNVTAYAVRVRSLPFTCLPLFNLFSLCLAGKQQCGTFAYCFHYIFDKDDWIPKPTECPVFVLNARVETTYTVAEAEEGSEELLPILQRE